MRYQYTSSGFKGYRPKINWGIPDGVKLIISINIIIFILVEISGFRYEIFKIFGLVPAGVITSFKIWQPLTYLFLHSGLFHILINMFVLWMFGRDLEYLWGKYSFVKYFILTGVGSGIITIIFDSTSQIPVVGASGAVYGVLMAYALSYPNRIVYLYGLFPVKVKYMISFIGVAAFFASISNVHTTISHLTHLSGMLIGLIYLKHNIILNQFKSIIPIIKIYDDNNAKEYKQKKYSSDKIDFILDKLKENGWDELTKSEKQQLFNASKYYSKDQPPN